MIDKQMSSLGFGCASLGSRVARKKGLRALARAHERGVNWFDLAPSYGDGDCETIFGDFARDRRDSLFICTKVGIGPARLSAVQHLVKPLARGIIGALPSLRHRIARTRSAQVHELTPGLIRTSLERSLRALRTDYVDVLALHDPMVESVTTDVVETLTSCMSQGLVRALGLTGNPATIRRIRSRHPAFTHVQCALDPLDGSATHLVATLRPASFAFHSINQCCSDLLTATARSPETIAKALADHDFEGSMNEGLRRALLQEALSFAETWGGVVLLSMFNERHLDRNLDALETKRQRTAGAEAMSVIRGHLAVNGETR